MACLRSKTDDCRVALKVSECEEERRGWGGWREEGMRIENVYRIRKAELGQSGVVGGFEGARGM